MRSKEQTTAEHVKSKTDSPAPTNKTAGGDTPEKTTDERVADAFEANRASKRQF
jgi:hypothetical protein